MKKLMAIFLTVLTLMTLTACSPAKEVDSFTETCTVSVYCNTLLDHQGDITDTVLELVPEDGVLLKETSVAFAEGDTAYDVTKKALQGAKMQFDASVSTLGTVYMEGISNIYAFDCGPLSGWLYKVNDEFYSMSCAAFALKPGDHVSWVYTCDLGYDVGGGGVDQTGA